MSRGGYFHGDDYIDYKEGSLSPSNMKRTNSNYHRESKADVLRKIKDKGRTPEERQRIQRINGEKYERKRKKLEQLNTIKKQMDDVLSQMRRGKTLSQAAISAGVSVSKVDKWYDYGWRTEKEPYYSFYAKINYLKIKQKKENRSKTKTTTTTSKNRVNSVIECSNCGYTYNHKLYLKCPNCNTSSDSSLKSSASKNNISKQMDEVVVLMKTGLSRSSAASKLNISTVTVNNWYNKGSQGDSVYFEFYRDVKKIENTKKKHQKVSKPKSSEEDISNKMSKIVSLMRNGLSRPDAADKLNINLATVNNWCNKGSKGDSDYIEFYRDVKNIENTQKKHQKVSKPIKSKPKSATSDMIKCLKCGEKYNRELNDECPNCEKSKIIIEDKYCQNCGKKLDSNDLDYCFDCKTSLNSQRNRNIVHVLIFIGILLIILISLIAYRSI